MVARYKSLVEAAMGEGKPIPEVVRNQSMFTGGVPGTAEPRRPLTKAEFDARFSSGERIPDGEIIRAKRTHPLTQSEYNAMIGERPAQAVPRSAKEPLPTPETAWGKIVEGQSIEGNPTGKVREPTIAGAGKTGERVPAGKGIEAGDDGFREGLIGKEGKRAESASDGFTEGLLGKEGKAGEQVESIYTNATREGIVELTVIPGEFDYKKTFFEKYPELEGKVVVHYSIEQQVLRRYPGLFSKAEIHSIERLRGIPNELNNEVHLSKIRKEWNRFYKGNFQRKHKAIPRKFLWRWQRELIECLDICFFHQSVAKYM